MGSIRKPLLQTARIRANAASHSNSQRHNEFQYIPVELGSDAPSKGLTPLCNNVLYQSSDDQICSVGVARACSLLHELQQIAVVSLVSLVVIVDGGKNGGGRSNETTTTGRSGILLSLVVPASSLAVGRCLLLQLFWLRSLLGGLNCHLVHGHNVGLIRQRSAKRPTAPLMQIPGDEPSQGGQIIVAPTHRRLGALLNESLENGANKLTELIVLRDVEGLAGPIIGRALLHVGIGRCLALIPLTEHILAHRIQPLHHVTHTQAQSFEQGIKGDASLLKGDHARRTEEVNTVMRITDTGSVGDLILRDGGKAEASRGKIELPNGSVILRTTVQPMVLVPDFVNKETFPSPLRHSHGATRNVYSEKRGGME